MLLHQSYLQEQKELQSQRHELYTACKSAREKARAVVEELRSMKLNEAAKKVEDGIEETLTYCDFPGEHWTRIRTNNVIERLNREIRRRTRVVGSFPDGNSALMLVCCFLASIFLHFRRYDSL